MARTVRLAALSLLTSLCALAVIPNGASSAEFGPKGTWVGDDGVITRSNLDPDEPWPLTIDRGTFVCEDEGVFISDGRTQYPLNGYAKTLAKTHPKNRKPLEDIWRVDEKIKNSTRKGAMAVDVVRVNITPVLNRGVEWCKRR